MASSAVPPWINDASTWPGKYRYPACQESTMMFSNGPAHAKPTPSARGAERNRTASVVPKTAQPATPPNTVA
jgi:hypothetical protein